MDLERTKHRLEQTLGVSIRVETLPAWDSPSISWEVNGTIYYKLQNSAEQASAGILAWAVDAREISPKERRLIELLLEAVLRDGTTPVIRPVSVNDEEGRARAIGEWIAGKLDEGDLVSMLPDLAFLRSFQYDSSLCLLLDVEFRESNRFTYKELKKLIDTYFESETVLIPLTEGEWIILASGAVLESVHEDGDNEESIEELMESIALSMHEMINEWIGDCRISAAGLIHAPTNLLQAIQNMRGSIRLGRLFHPEESVYLPWKLQLERLLYTMEEREKKRFLEQLMKNTDASTLDSEMLTTLKTFFQHNCNISETSKALYIHRNTLLYRLDKFKQATGMDVRNFHDAVLIHMALLLYKVTKWD